MTALLATTSIIAAGLLGGIPPARAQDGAVQAAGDPPGRVGRLARLDGTVSAHGAGSTQWTPAVLNFPFASGDSLWTQPRAQAEIQFGADLVTIADSTELDVDRLDDHHLVAAEPQGALFLDLRDVQPGDTYTINTPRGAVQIATDGEYEILAGDTSTPTRVAVVRGAAQLTSGALALRAGPGQMAVASGDQDVQGDVEPLASYDPFLTAMIARNSAPVDAPRAVEGMTGGRGLSRYGAWQQSPQYGEVWVPQVGPDWVPYRDGSWSYVAPWGWTWVDNEPWGFAPFHYGRWAQSDGRWCWVPTQEGAAYDPVPAYAPALVDFVVAGAAAGAVAGVLAASLSSGRGDVGWVPLGPREAYDPPYGGSSRYRNRLNWGGGWHQASWNDRHDHNQVNNTTNNFFLDHRGLTVVPAAAMIHSQQIRPIAHAIDSPRGRGFQNAPMQPLRGPLPIRPVAETRGLTPKAARRLDLAEGPRHAVAPGPPIRAAVPHPASAPGGRIRFGGASVPNGSVPNAAVPAAGHAPGPGGLPAMVHGPTPPQAPLRAQTAHGLPGPVSQRVDGPRMARPGRHPSEAGQAPVPQRPPAQMQAIQARPAPNVEASRQLQARPAAPRPEPARFAPARAPARPAAPRVEAPRVEAPRAPAPRGEPPRPGPHAPGQRPDH